MILLEYSVAAFFARLSLLEHREQTLLKDVWACGGDFPLCLVGSLYSLAPSGI